MVDRILFFLLIAVLSQVKPIPLISQKYLSFLKDIPGEYSITKTQIYEATSEKQPLTKNHFVKNSKTSTVLPQDQGKSPSTDPNKEIQKDNEQIPPPEKDLKAKIKDLDLKQNNNIKFKAMLNTELKRISEISVLDKINNQPVEVPFKQNLRVSEDHENNQKQPTSSTSNQQGSSDEPQLNVEEYDKFKFGFSVLMFVAVVVIIFGFPDKNRQKMSPVKTEDEDEENQLK